MWYVSFLESGYFWDDRILSTRSFIKPSLLLPTTDNNYQYLITKKKRPKFEIIRNVINHTLELSVVSRNPSRMFSNMTAALHIFQDIWHIPRYQAHSRKSGILQEMIWHIPGYLTYSTTSGIFQEICHPPGNLLSSKKSGIFQEIKDLPVNMPSSRKSWVFQEIRHIPGNQASSRISRIFQEIRNFPGNQGMRSWTFFKCVLSAPDQVNNFPQFGHICLCFSCIL